MHMCKTYFSYIIYYRRVSVAITTMIKAPALEYWWNTTNCHIAQVKPLIIIVDVWSSPCGHKNSWLYIVKTDKI
jgi:hypothetical protein